MHRMESQNIDSKFRLILLAAERAERLLNGALWREPPHPPILWVQKPQFRQAKRCANFRMS